MFASATDNLHLSALQYLIYKEMKVYLLVYYCWITSPSVFMIFIFITLMNKYMSKEVR